ncbi:A/G-specific adenine glycosylase [Oceanobacillus kapialis]|uniref:Adenine DNA glycosylase n=1 Tax=Oceanobacillus kapialis TaxID=481353 RepID=A0ABW5PZV8_9BACI
MKNILLQNFNISDFQKDLINWYQANKRDLPWRKDQDPYKVWVSEIMLQQTKVDTVIPYFHCFISNFPTVEALAAADQQDVLKSWEGLGYYSRARNLQNAVREVVASYDGVVPDNPKELGDLKGIGPYTKGAILSIAYNKPEPAVDGNVMRVFSRLFYIEDDIAQPKTRKLFEAYVREVIDHDDPSSFNQAVMELGAIICTPKSPACMLCPVQEYCQAFSEGVQENLPVKKKAKKQRKIPYVALLIRTPEDKYVIEKRSSDGLLADLWQFPMVPVGEIGYSHIESWFYQEYGISLNMKDHAGKLKHVFSHLIWELEIYHAEAELTTVEDERLRLVAKEDIANYPFPVSHQKMMVHLNTV